MQRRLIESLLLELHWPKAEVLGAAMRRMAYKAKDASETAPHYYTDRGQTVTQKDHAVNVLGRLMKRVTRSTDLDYKEAVIQGGKEFDTAARRSRFVGNVLNDRAGVASKVYKFSRSRAPLAIGLTALGGLGAYGAYKWHNRKRAASRSTPAVATPRVDANNYPFKD